MGRKGKEKAAPKKEEKKDKKGKKGKEPASAKKKEGGDDDEEEEPEDLLGDNEWAKTNEADFSNAVDDMFGDILAMKAQFEEETPEHLRDVKMAKLGDDTAVEEAAEAAKAKEEEEKEKAEEEEAERRRIRAEKKANMTPEEKKAKTNCNMKYKPKAKVLSDDGKLADTDAYARALKAIEDEEFVKAEEEFKAAIGTQPEPEPEPEDEPEPEPEEEEEAAAAEEPAEEPAEEAAEEVAAEPEPEPDGESPTPLVLRCPSALRECHHWTSLAMTAPACSSPVILIR